MSAWFTDALEAELMTQTRSNLPSECAGLIGANAYGSTKLFPCPPQTTTPTGFHIPAQLYWSLRAAKVELVGIYHSHPSGSDTLSRHDLRSMSVDGIPSYPGVEWLIIPCTNDTVLRPVRYVWCDKHSEFKKRL